MAGMEIKRRALIVVTNQDHYDGHDTPTGLWLSEMTHFWDELEPLGFGFDLVSPNGGGSPLEPRALSWPNLDASARRRFDDPEYMARLSETLAAEDVDPSRYDVIYFTGGHGVMYDFAGDMQLERLARAIYERGGVVSAVCHGYCGLLDVRLSSGEYLIAGKRMTGFSWREEVLSGVARLVPYNAEKRAIERGARYSKRVLPFFPHVVQDGNLVTGQNPSSARKTARGVIDALGLRG